MKRTLRLGLAASALFLAVAPAIAADAGEVAAQVCAACHGPDGNGVAPTFPKLAGQSESYLNKQLEEFFSGKRKGDVMTPTLASFSKGDVPGLARYYAGQAATPSGVADAGLAAAGKKLYEEGNPGSGIPACAGCHQLNGQGSAAYPRLAGQYQTYTLQQMSDFKTGKRNNDRAKVMRVVAERMTEEEMKAVAEYTAGLK
jgi:cytochrome c553